MAKNLSTRIGLKIDTLAAWNESTIPLLAGELAIATIAAGAGSGLSEPVIMIKIGEDGKKTFKELDWALHAKASDVYGWAKQSEADFVTNFLALTNGTNTLEQLLDAKFATDEELTKDIAALRTEITNTLANYYTKTETDAAIKVVSDALANEVTRATEAEAQVLADAKAHTDAEIKKITDETGYATETYVNNKVAEHEQAVAKTLESYSTTEQMAAAIDADVKVVADALNAYQTAHAEDYTNAQIDAAIDADVKVVADNLAEYVEAHKDDYTNAQIDDAIAAVADDFAGYYTKTEIDDLVQGAKDYADANDANDNTTYTIGYESKVEGESGHPARIVLTPSEGEPTYVDATPFIKDGMLDNVAYDADSNTLTFTFNTDAGKEAVTVELTDILAPYTGHVGETITVTVDGNTIKAELNTTVTNDIATAKSDAAQAKADATAAVGTANTANATANEAKVLAQGAVTTANEAKDAATEAQNSAAASAEAAEGHAADALASKNAAAQSATDAANAQTAAETAQGLAEDPKDAAETAQAAAEAAQGKAEVAQVAAEAAQAAAENSNASATAIANTAKETAENAATVAGEAKTAATKATEDVAGLTNKVNNLTTDDIDGGTEVWIFNCGTATTVI